MKTIIEWLVKHFLRDFHLAKNPHKGRKNKVKAVCVDPPHGVK